MQVKVHLFVSCCVCVEGWRVYHEALSVSMPSAQTAGLCFSFLSQINQTSRRHFLTSPWPLSCDSTELWLAAGDLKQRGEGVFSHTITNNQWSVHLSMCPLKNAKHKSGGRQPSCSFYHFRGCFATVACEWSGAKTFKKTKKQIIHFDQLCLEQGHKSFTPDVRDWCRGRLVCRGWCM